MNLIITMAGKYMRFKEAGYTTPKFLLPLNNGLTVFEEIIRQLVSDYMFEHIVFIANNDDIMHDGAIKNAIEASGIEQFHLLFVKDTKGQAETALHGVDRLEKESCKSQKIIIHNIDTILYDRNFNEIDGLLDQFSGFIDVFEADNQRYSYVNTDSQNVVTEIREKEVISRKATTGLYAFSDMNVYSRYVEQLKTDKEHYISYIYDLMLRDEQKITINSKTAKTVILGTPEEYESYINSI